MDKTTVIVADDLTGACDTALQYFKSGRRAKVVIDESDIPENLSDSDVWSVSTESRNIPKEEASQKVIDISVKLKEILKAEKFFKKIDSTLRGNVGVEIVSVLDALNKDIAIVAPAYIEEERATIGGFQLLRGVPIERTQCALDPKAPIYESYIPDIIKRDLNEKFSELIDIIDFKTVTKGAGPITLKINELVQKGKRIIIVDAVSNTDLEQIALATKKCGYDVLPCASAGLAGAFNKITDGNVINRDNIDIPNIQKLIVSGSATKLTASQILKLKENKNIFAVDLTVKDILGTEIEELSELISEKLKSGLDVVVHTSEINNQINEEEISNLLIDAGIAKNELSSKITDYLSDLVYEINFKNNFILVLIGGETSHKCLTKINSGVLNILDAISLNIPLCKDVNEKIIVTKSGNFGTQNTLVEILNYFDRLK